MAIKLVAVDMDDTLLNSDLTVTARTREAIRRAQAQGVIVTIATGRMFTSALPYARQLAMTAPIITYNGGMVRAIDSDAPLFHQEIAADVAQGILALARERGWYMQSYWQDELYVVERCAKARSYEALAGISAKPIGEALYTLEHMPTKMLSMAEPELLQEIEQTLNEQFAGRIFTATSKDTYLELTHPAVNKGHALAVLAEHLGIDRTEIMAIGDSNNDYPMLEYAGWGVAMGNAADRVKGVAQAVTADNDADGVAKAIETYVLI